jgi:hypothetical protein
VSNQPFGTIMIAVALKPYRCGLCGRRIEFNQRHEIATGRAECGEWYSKRTCMTCVNSRTPHHCGDDAGHAAELRRETAEAAKKWEDSNDAA